MGIHVARLAKLDAAIEARHNGGEVESYSLPDGTNISLVSLTDLYKLRDSEAILADQEAASTASRGNPAFRRARLRPS